MAEKGTIQKIREWKHDLDDRALADLRDRAVAKEEKARAEGRDPGKPSPGMAIGGAILSMTGRPVSGAVVGSGPQTAAEAQKRLDQHRARDPRNLPQNNLAPTEQQRRTAPKQAVDQSAPAIAAAAVDVGRGASGEHNSRQIRAATRGPNGRFAPPPPPTMAQSVGASVTHAAEKAQARLAHANPALLGISGLASAKLAYDATTDAGGSKGRAIGAAAVAATPAAAALAAPAALAKFAPAAANVLGKAALPLTAAAAVIGAVRKGTQAYKQGEGAGGVAAATALGAIDSVTGGLASMAYDGRLRATLSTAASRAGTVATQVGSVAANLMPASFAANPSAPKAGAFINDAAEAKAAAQKGQSDADGDGARRAMAQAKPRHTGPVEVKSYTRNGVQVGGYQRAMAKGA